jgi:hypothetical protein
MIRISGTLIVIKTTRKILSHHSQNRYIMKMDMNLYSVLCRPQVYINVYMYENPVWSSLFRL